MNRGDDFLFPQDEHVIVGEEPTLVVRRMGGATLREYAAIQIMAQCMGSEWASNAADYEGAAGASVEAADALLARLGAEK